MFGKTFFTDLKKYDGVLGQIAADYAVPKAWIVFDCLRCRYLHGAMLPEYVALSLHQVSHLGRKKYVTQGRSKKLEAQFNTGDRRERDLIGNKLLFNRTYAKFVRRKWVYAPESTDEEVLALLRACDAVMVKPLLESKGKGIRKLDCGELLSGDIGAFLAQARESKLLIEEFLIQHPEMSAVNPTSVNTIRVCSARDPKGEVHIIGASLRGGGAGSVVDNFHADGVQYPIELSSGCICRGGVRFNGEHNVLFHPSTQKKMIGFRVPNWETVLETVREAAALPEHLRYIGWDIAVTEEGCEIIEANIGQGSNGMQQDGIGKYPIIRQYI